jgi:glycosyltransferase involved in cell wall biosynthesis
VLPRLLIVGPTPPPYNGMSVTTAGLLASRLREEFELIHLDTADRRGLQNVGRFDWWNVFLAARHAICFLYSLIRFRPELIYLPIAQNSLGYLRDCLFLMPARILRQKVIVHLHGSDFAQFYRRSPWWLKSLIRWTLFPVRRAVVLGTTLRGLFKGLIDFHRVVAVPNGVAPIAVDRENESYAGRRSHDPGKVNLLYLGTLAKSKGFMEVIRCALEVSQKQPNVRFVLAGETYNPGDVREAYEFVREHNLEDVVEIRDPVFEEQKALAYLDADIFLFPPVASEGQPLVILEAMSAGLPIISTPQGAIPETVIDGRNGFLVPPGDTVNLAEKVLFLVGNRELRSEMGRLSRARYLKYYTLEGWAERMGDLFRAVLNENL